MAFRDTLYPLISPNNFISFYYFFFISGTTSTTEHLHLIISHNSVLWNKLFKHHKCYKTHNLVVWELVLFVYIVSVLCIISKYKWNTIWKTKAIMVLIGKAHINFKQTTDFLESCSYGSYSNTHSFVELVLWRQV